MGLRVAVQANVADLGRGDQIDHRIHHAESGTQDRDDRHFLARQHAHLCLGDGGLDLHLFGGQTAGGLVAHQRGDLTDDFAEFLDAGILVAEDRQLVLQQRMFQYM